MDTPISIRNAGKPPEILSPSGSLRRRSSSASNSPEFEFWRLTNPSAQPDPDLMSADELFLDGVLLPLHHLSLNHPHPTDSDSPKPDPDRPSSDPTAPEPEPAPDPEPGPGPGPGSGPELTRETAALGFTASKRWREIFRMSESKPRTKSREEKEKESKRREKKSKSGSGSGAELNINIWPFSRSRSAGNSVTRPRISFGAPATRKVSSAPCSRSNSAGESKSRKWPSSPGRVGVHLGRSSPVWQVRRGKPISEPAVSRGSVERGVAVGGKREIMEGRKGKTVNESHKAKVLNLSVPMCIGYRNRLNCRSDEGGSSSNRSGNSNIGSGNSNPNTNGTTNSRFGLRNLFIKKVHGHFI